MAFSIQYSSDAVKQLKKLDSGIRKQILKRLLILAENPSLAKPLSNDFKNLRSEHVGKFRVLISVKEKDSVIIVLKVKHRKDVYD